MLPVECQCLALKFLNRSCEKMTKYNVGDVVVVRMPRCPCNGGGYDEVIKTIQRVTEMPHNNLVVYHISSNQAVPECNIIRKV